MQDLIGARIKKRRKELNMTQKQLAGKIGVTFQAVSKWENGTSLPDIGLIPSIAKALDMDVNEIISGKAKSAQNKKTENRPFYGKVTGTVTKDIHADVGQIIGDVRGDIYGDVKGNIIGSVKNVYGNIEGSVWGSVNGDVTGYIKGNLWGAVTGSVKQGVHGRIMGQIIGDGINIESPAGHKKGYKGLIGMDGFIAKWYDKTTGNRADEFKSIAKKIKTNVKEKCRVLEVAPGPGYLAIELAKMGDYKISGLDISETFVEIAKENAIKADVKIDFQQGNAAYMPFDNNTFDFIVCTAAFKNFSEPIKSLKEMYRVLKPNGKALIVDLRRDVSNEEINSYVRKMNLSWINSLITKLTFKHMLIKRAYSKEEFIGFISNTGFDKYEIYEDPTLLGFEIWLRKY